MDQKAREICADDINLSHNWGRVPPALGIMGVDFGGARRLPAAASLSRLARVKKALENSELGALLVIRRQQHPVHHVDQDRRMGARQAFTLGAANLHSANQPTWDFGSAAVHHQALHTMASRQKTARAGLIGLRGRNRRPLRSGLDEVPNAGGNRFYSARGRRRRHADRRRHKVVSFLQRVKTILFRPLYLLN